MGRFMLYFRQRENSKERQIVVSLEFHGVYIFYGNITGFISKELHVFDLCFFVY
jgi:hypothetical protein